jgi:predicted AAA+ superfamily ATPase
MQQFQLKEGYILTYNQEEEIKENWYTIHVLPVWKWIIEK